MARLALELVRETGRGALWLITRFWGWGVAVFLSGLGLSAMFGDQYIAAAGFYFAAVVIAAVKLSLEAKADNKKAGTFPLILVGSVIVFVASLWWIKYTHEKLAKQPDATPAIVEWVWAHTTYVRSLPWRWIFISTVVGFVASSIISLKRRRKILPLKTNGKELALSDAYTDGWLREVLQSDRESIRRLVKVFIVDWKSEFSTDILRPYIDFRFAVSNISICAIQFEDSIKGDITFLKEGAKKKSQFRDKPVLAPNQELYVLPRKPGVLIVRQWLDREEASEIETSGKESKFWLGELEVYFYGEGINRSRLFTTQSVTKEKGWIANPGLYCAYDDEQALATRIETLTTENESLKALLDAERIAQQEERETIPEQPRPNIIPVGYGKRNITFDPSTQTFITVDTGMLALVVQFRNSHEYGKQISEATDIRAHIYFEPSQFYETLDRDMPGFAKVEEGIWLAQPSHIVNFARGATGVLVLAVQMEENGFGGFDAFEHSISVKPDGTKLFLPRIPKLSADKYVVKVEITGGARGDIAELHHFTITLRPEFNIFR
jgi:hypothetical protein